jgi:uncharacterized delta-60 repeat protein
VPIGGWLALGSVGGRNVMARYLASGGLDLAFGNRGVLELASLPPQISPTVFELDSAGRWLIGAKGAGCASHPCVFRLHPDGTLDATFHNGGTAPPPPGNAGAEVGRILPLAGGGMIVAGPTSSGGTGMLRMMPDGAVDAAFGSNGITEFPARSLVFGLPSDSGALSIRAASAGGLYLAKVNYARDFPYVEQPDLHRTDVDGHPDPAFGSAGTVQLNVSGTSFGEIEELPGGRFVGLGTTSTGGGGSGNNFLFQFDATGTLDGAFGIGGKADAGVRGEGGPRIGSSPRFARSGSKYLVPGALSGDLALARLNADGSPDPSFGTSGIVVAGLTAGAQMSSMAVATGVGGEILAVGNATSPPTEVTLHVDAGGSATSQYRAVAMPFIDAVASMATVTRLVVSNGGKVGLIGNSAGAPGDGAVAVLDASGNPLPAFGAGGHVLASDLGMLGTVWTDGVFQTDEKLVIAGYNGASNRLMRLGLDGTPDPTFAGTGVLQYMSAGGTARSAAVAVQSDGKIVTAALGPSSAAIQRFSALGAPDAGFGVGGESDVAGPFPFASIAAVMISPGGNILVAGGADFGLAAKWFVLRMLSNGQPDVSYGSGGFVYVTPGGPLDTATIAAAMRPDGSVVLGGSVDATATLARLTPAGQLDATFGAAGVQPLFPNGSNAMSITVSDAGDTLVAAQEASRNWLAMRLLSGGSPDPVFGFELLGTAPDTDALQLATRGTRIAVAGTTQHVGVDARVLVKAYTVASSPPALPQRSFVASYGTDAGPCSVAAPCRTLARALKNTARGGEVLLLDSADFGSATILTSVSVVAPQNARPAVAAATGLEALTVSATPSDTIVLRGLAVAGQIVVNGGGSLHLENLTVHGLNSGPGVWFRPVAPARISIKDSTIRSSSYGIAIVNGSDVGALLDNVRLEGNTRGLYVKAGGNVAVRNTLVAGSSYSGIELAGGGGMPLTATLDRVSVVESNVGLTVIATDPVQAFARNSTFANNGTFGIRNCCLPSAVWLDGNRITHNGAGLDGGGAINSRGNNTIEANGTDGAPTGTYGAK